MSHYSNRGFLCGLRDNHPGNHRTVAAIERKLVMRQARRANPEWAEAQREVRRERLRVKRATDPEWAERNRERIRTWKRNAKERSTTVQMSSQALPLNLDVNLMTLRRGLAQALLDQRSAVA